MIVLYFSVFLQLRMHDFYSIESLCYWPACFESTAVHKASSQNESVVETVEWCDDISMIILVNS